MAVMWVSPFLARARGHTTASAAGTATRHAAIDRLNAFQPPAVMGVESTSWARSMAVLDRFDSAGRPRTSRGAALRWVACPTMRWRVKAVAIAAVTAVVTVAGVRRPSAGPRRGPIPPSPIRNAATATSTTAAACCEDSSIQEMLGADERGAALQRRGVPVRAGARSGLSRLRHHDRRRLLLVRDRQPGPGTGTGRSSAAHRSPTRSSNGTRPSWPAAIRTGAGCSATAAAGPGVLSWWVQIRGKSDADPCEDAEKLLAATLSSDL